MMFANDAKEKTMKILWIAVPLLVAGCSAPAEQKPLPAQVGMANPAAVYCLERHGERFPVQTPQGVRTECKLPGGETIEEWDLYRRDHVRSGQ
ncbi:hypothetical protein EDF81_0050 [Enterobacter sp. BIGb0383]|nr:hypothetical protein EDF81_0050 [Enterobacter sp. BIGb0383]ROS11740.1 hypothetical protein EC848_0050 [Enterobacter sp. BIGb0359]